MKQKIIFLAGVLLGGLIPSFSQDVLPEVTITAVRYKYLKAVDNKDLAQPVKLLEKMAAEYDVKTSSFYEDEYDSYFVSFFIPDGEILAAYDADGKLLRTAEKFKNIALPKVVAEAVNQKYPDWRVSKDVYLVSYMEEKGAKKVYKLLLEKGDRRMKIKTNENGEFL